MSRIVPSCACLAGLLLAVSFASAQTQNPQQSQGTQPRQSNPNVQGGASSSSSATQGSGRNSVETDRGASSGHGASMMSGRSPDAELAACLIVDNECAVTAGQIAQQRSQNEEVKQFAQQMVQAHGQMIAKLQQVAGEAGAGGAQGATGRSGTGSQSTSGSQTTSGRASDPSEAARAGGTTPGAGSTVRSSTQSSVGSDAAARSDQTAGGRSSMQHGGRLDHVALKRELGELSKQTLQRELSQKTGSEFDMCYIGGQIQAHLHAIDAMKVAQNHASGELRPLLDQGIQEAQTHLQHAKDLAKKLETAYVAEKSNGAAKR